MSPFFVATMLPELFTLVALFLLQSSFLNQEAFPLGYIAFQYLWNDLRNGRRSTFTDDERARVVSRMRLTVA